MKTTATLWQSPAWESFQKALGQQCQRLSSSEALMITYPLPGGYRYGYIPRGPIDTSHKGLTKLDTDLKELPDTILFLRCDPSNEYTALKHWNTRKCWSPQPQATLQLDLSDTEEQLLKHMKRKGRYNIKLAQKKGIQVRRAKNTKEQRQFVKYFYKLLQETTKRDQFAGHNEQYYQTMVEKLKGALIYVAFWEEQPLAAAINVRYQDSEIYYYGASSSAHRHLMAPYALQWKAIQKAKEDGKKMYDLFGIAPRHASEDHPWMGVTQFKRKFGGKRVRYPHAFDIILKPRLYRVYRILKFFQNLIR